MEDCSMICCAYVRVNKELGAASYSDVDTEN